MYYMAIALMCNSWKKICLGTHFCDPLMSVK